MKQLSSTQIRQMFLEYFQKNGHMIEKGHSLVPQNDPTLLWINSGVAALKKYFDGSVKPKSNRITNAQKAIRSNDIENVGKTSRHHTFFEMLGNFSIGDYFKKEAIHFAWEFLTSEEWMNINKEVLYITVHTGDDEAYDIWVNDIGIDPSHIVRFEENFWQIGEGPCGPNSEIIVDRGERFDSEKRGIQMFLNDEENDRYVELWNIVFSQYNGVEGVDRSEYKELPQKNIDTGMGFERLVSIMQDGETNFDTDLFLPIISKTELYSTIKYQEDPVSYRVIADHIRTVTFALADGALFSNEGRGYVLRRIIRRAIRYGKKLQIKQAFMYELVEVVAEIMKDYYPELESKVELIKRLVKIEEERFESTLNDGEKLLENVLLNSENKIVLGDDAFKLYDTYGFPFELTVEIAQERGFSVDEEGFRDAMRKQKELSKTARVKLESFSEQHEDLMNFTLSSEFIGYKTLDLKAKVIGLFKDGKIVDTLDDEGDVVFDKTVFYAESGGQINDTGLIENDGFSAKVVDVQKAPHNQFLHHINNVEGVLHVGDSLDLSVDKYRRQLITRNHSSVHLLDAALRLVLGNHVTQAGSFVGDEYARFDFTHFEKVSKNQQVEIETIVNNWIFEAHASVVEYLPIDEAKQSGAIALFDEKYGDIVRVVSMGEFSKEFCGGCHVENTEEIGLFKIVSEESIGSGTRRLTTKASKSAFEYLNNMEEHLLSIANKLKVNSISRIDDKLASLEKQSFDLEKQLEKLQQELMNNEIDRIKELFLKGSQYNTLLFKSKLDGKLAKNVVDNLANELENTVVFGAFVNEDKINFACRVPKIAIEKGIKAGDLVKQAAIITNGNGGGKPDFAQAGGKDTSKVDESLEFIQQIVAL